MICIVSSCEGNKEVAENRNYIDIMEEMFFCINTHESNDSHIKGGDNN